LVNGSDEKRDLRYSRLVGCNGISMRDIVARAVFRYPYTPTEDEVENVAKDADFFYKKVDWKGLSEEIPKAGIADIKFPENIEMELIKLLESGKITKKDKIILFSVTKTTQYILERLKEYEVIAVLDNNKSLSGTQIDGIPIYNPAEFLQGSFHSEYKIIVPTRSYQYICEQLHYYGYELGKQVFVTYQEPFRLDNNRELDTYISKVTEGEKRYMEIREKYPNTRIYVCPYPGTGDLYLVGMYLKDRLKYDEIENCVIVVTSGSCNRILSLFHLESELKETIVLKNREEAEQLLAYTRGIGSENANTWILNNDGGVIDLGYMSGCKGLDFNTLFQKVVFYADERRSCEKMCGQSADAIFETYYLKKGKTILLSPYVNTINGVSRDVWIALAAKLKEKGYDVCTNVSNDTESAIEGTQGIFIPYAQIMDFLDKAGGFIGFRSGLCDIISSSNAKKVILYPKERAYVHTTYYNYFSLERMGIANGNLLELEIGDEKRERIQRQIIEFLI